MCAAERPVSLAGSTMVPHYHACAFFNSRDEEYDVLLPFIREGMAQGDKAVHVTDPSHRSDHLDRLRQGGVDIDAAEARRQLAVLDWHAVYLKGGGFDPDAMMALVEALIREAQADGFSRTRIIGHMGWALEDKPGVERLLEYEVRINRVLCSHRQPAVCAYDVTQFPASTMLEILRIHPLVVIGGVLQENPFYVPPDDYLHQRQSS